MATTQPLRYSRLARHNYAEGEAKGRAEGKAEAELTGERRTLQMVLRARGLALTDDQSAQLEACKDLAVLTRWSQAALTAKDPSDIFR